MLGAGTVLVIASGAILSTVALLGAGYRVGSLAGKSTDNSFGKCDCAAETARLRQRLDRCLAAVDGVSLQSGALSTIMATHGDAIPADCRRAVRRLIDTANLLTARIARAAAESNVLGELSRPIENVPEIAAAQSQPITAPVSTAASDELSSAEIEEAAGLQDLQTQNGKIARRYPYDCHQSITPWYGDEPEPAAIEQALVRCHDISVDGISFFWPSEPDFEQAIITIGQGDNRKRMAAKIMYSKAVFMHSEFKFLIGCRFIKRMS